MSELEPPRAGEPPNPPPKRPPRRRTTRRRETRGDELWKWLLRLSALAGFFYVLIAHQGAVPLGVYVVIAGFAGLPNILGLQQALGSGTDEDQ